MVCWEKRGCGCAKRGHGLKEHEENSSGFSPLQRGSLPYGEKCYGCAFHPQPKIISELLGGREPGGGEGDFSSQAAAHNEKCIPSLPTSCHSRRRAGSRRHAV